MAHFAYTSVDAIASTFMPYLVMSLSIGKQAVEVTGLLDTGASVNVLPYHVGLTLGAVWEEQTVPVSLVGSLGMFEARALIVAAAHPQLTADKSVRLAFAWTQSDDVPVIFGQMNFFLTFDVCFYRSQNTFEVNLKTSD